MKPICSCVFFSALSFAIPAGAEIAGNPENRSRLKIIQTEEAVFPLTLRNSQVLDGTATVAVDVDQNGVLTDWLVTAY